jgi:hypothetical protein
LQKVESFHLDLLSASLWQGFAQQQVLLRTPSVSEPEMIKKTATDDESYFRFSLKTGKFMRAITPETVRKG